MEYVPFGRTGLTVSVAGLGCGGSSRLGLATGRSEAEAVALVRGALDLGVTLIDTAAVYGTEGVVGQALAGVPRDRVVIATKAGIDNGPRGGDAFAPEVLVKSLDNSLRLLRTDHVDIFQVQGVPPEHYDYVRDVIAPALARERDKGKLRFLGLSESGRRDLDHAMLRRALDDDIWSSLMMHYNMMHQNAGETVLPRARAQGVGTLLMYVVRSVFSHPDELRATLRELAASAALPQALAEAREPLDFLIHEGGAASLTDAAYRFARHDSGADVILFGTGDIGHLRANVASILSPPLPDADRRQIRALFGRLVGIGV